MASTAPFAKFEWMIAWRYIRAKRAEGGVSIMTWISLVGVTLAVFALIATLAVRSGFRAEFVDTILGSNAHVTVYQQTPIEGTTQTIRTISDYDALSEALGKVEGVTRAAPLVRGQVMANSQNRNAGIEVYGITLDNLMTSRASPIQTTVRAASITSITASPSALVWPANWASPSAIKSK